MLQGGGALGSYQAGAFEALAASDYAPDWVAGISIGAINGAIIAGNAPQDRVTRLRAFWERITAPSASWPDIGFDWPVPAGALWALAFGQPGFFAPRRPLDLLGRRSGTSYYDTSLLRSTLEELVDFDRINAPGTTRLSVGAVNVRSAEFVYFDSETTRITPAHVMASAALPPAFPPVEIDGEHYWDGGIVSNTPLHHVIDYFPRDSRIIFQVDLFKARGDLPETLEEISEREKDVRFSSRTRMNTDVFTGKHEIRFAINAFLSEIPESFRDSAAARKLLDFSCETEMDVVHLIFRPGSRQSSAKDYEFSRAAMLARWAQGAADMAETLVASPWLEPNFGHAGARVFDVVHSRLVASSPAASEAAARTSKP